MYAIISIDHIFLGPPTIHNIGNGQTSFEGEKVNLTCTASNDFDSSESLKIKWYGPRGTQLTSEIKNVNIYNTTNSITGQITSVLLLDSVNDTDTGGYTCRALNHPKSYTEKRTSLNVECEIVVYCEIYVEYVYSSLNHNIILCICIYGGFRGAFLCYACSLLIAFCIGISGCLECYILHIILLL